MASSGRRRAVLAFLGMVAGVLLTAAAAWIYIKAAQVERARTEIGASLVVPEEATRLEDIDPPGSLRVALAGASLVGGGGETLAAASAAVGRLDASTLQGEGPIVFSSLQVDEPFVRLVQTPAGDWTYEQVLAGGDGEDADGAGGRPVVMRDVVLRDGSAFIALPGEPFDTAAPPLLRDMRLRHETIAGTTYRVFEPGDVDASLPLVRLAGAADWRVEIASATANLAEPELRLALSGSARAAAEDAIDFTLASLRFGGSEVEGSGRIRFAEAGLAYDLQVVAAPLRFADLQPLLPTLPDEGMAGFTLGVETRDDGRTRLAFSGLAVDALESSISGRLTALVGGDAAPVFTDTELAIDSLRLLALEDLGLIEEAPFLGTLRGTVTSEAPIEGGEGPLRLSLSADLVPRGQPQMEPSMLVAEGLVRLTAGEPAIRFDGLRLGMQPLYLAALADMFPEQQEQLRGTVMGAVTVSGSPETLTLDDGELTYEVGDAQPTRLAGLAGTVSTQPQLSYDLRASAQPLALSTLTELFPALPFRTATLAGPLRVVGGSDEVRLSADLSGDAGAVRLTATAFPGDPLRFDVEGDVEAFTASAVIAGDLPIEGAVTGTFAAAGSVSDFTFDVDLLQTAGRFALEGRVREDAGMAVEVAGNVSDFRIGALIGRPGLFPSPMSGRIELSGGGPVPYVFDFELVGDDALLDVSGSYLAADVPVYDITGRVEGLDVRRLPLPMELPRSQLNASIAFHGRGLTPETVEGTYWLNAQDSRIGGAPLRAALVDVAVAGGILDIDTVQVHLRDTRMSAEGSWGLTRAAEGALQYSIDAPDLTTLANLLAPPGTIQPQVSGSAQIEGTLAGTFEEPRVTLALRGRGLRYQDWRAGTLNLSLRADADPQLGWSGEASIAGGDVVLAGGERLRTLTAELDGSQSRLAVGLFASRPDASDITVAGQVELVGLVPRGIELNDLTLRAGDVRWDLVGQTRIRWGGVDGMAVQTLELQRSGPAPGSILVNGRIPPQGDADFTMQARGVDLSDIGLFVGNVPDVGGVLSLDAVLEGPVGDPGLSVIGRVDDWSIDGVQIDSLSLNSEYVDDALQVQAWMWLQEQRVLQLDAGIPMSIDLSGLAPSFELRREGALTGTVDADSLPIDVLASLFPQTSEGAGFAAMQVELGGTLDSPRLNGWTRLSGGAVYVEPLGVRFEDIRGLLTLEQNRIRVDSLRATSDGTASVDGTIVFEPQRGPRLNLTGDFNNFEVVDQEGFASMRTTGSISLTGELPQPTLTGRLRAEDATFWIPELDEPTGIEITDADVGQIGADTLQAGGPLPPFLAGMQINRLQVEVGDNVNLVNNDARIQITGDNLVVYRTDDDLRIFGSLQTPRGSYRLQVGPITREFEIVRGRIQFVGTPDMNPTLDILAANEARTGSTTGSRLNVLVNITGTLEFPRINFLSESRVPLPESELLSYLIFGRPSFELGGAVRADQFLVQETLGGFLSGLLEREVGDVCDYFQAQTTLTGGLDASRTGFECGRQIANDLFLTVELMSLTSTPLSTWALNLEWLIDRETTALASWAPVQTQTLLLATEDIPYQFSLLMQRRWEYGRSDAAEDLQLDIDEDLLPADGGLPGAPPPLPPPADVPPDEPDEPEQENPAPEAVAEPEGGPEDEGEDEGEDETEDERRLRWR